MPRKKSKRKTVRYPPGKTKSDILFLLADGDMSRPDLISEIKRLYNIRQVRGIQRHFDDLYGNKYRYVTKFGKKGKETYYQLSREPRDFFSILLFLHENNRLKDFISTTYFRDLNKTSYLIDLVSQRFLENIIEYIRIEMEEQQNLKQDEKQFKEIIMALSRPITSTRSNTMNEVDVESVFTRIEVSDLSLFIRLLTYQKNDDEDPKDHYFIDIATISSFLFPRLDRPDIEECIQTSPSSVEYLLSVCKYETSRLPQIIYSYSKYYSSLYSKFKGMKIKKQTKYSDKELDAFRIYMNKQKSIPHSPIYEILRAYRTIDRYNGNLITTPIQASGGGVHS